MLMKLTGSDLVLLEIVVLHSNPQRGKIICERGLTNPWNLVYSQMARGYLSLQGITVGSKKRLPSVRSSEGRKYTL
jgi:hypothetical protein